MEKGERGELVAERGTEGGANQPGHHQEESHGRDIEPACTISARETTGTRWRL